MKILITETQLTELNNRIQLVESGQVFDVEESKPQIIDFVQTIKDGENPILCSEYDLFYNKKN